MVHIWTCTFKNIEIKGKRRNKESRWSCPHRGLSDKNNTGEWLCHRGPPTLKLHLSRHRRSRKWQKSGSHFICRGGKPKNKGSEAGRPNKSAVKGSLRLNNPIKITNAAHLGRAALEVNGGCSSALRQNTHSLINVRRPLKHSITPRYARLHVRPFYTHPQAWPVSVSKIFFPLTQNKINQSTI